MTTKLGLALILVLGLTSPTFAADAELKPAIDSGGVGGSGVGGNAPGYAVGVNSKPEANALKDSYVQGPTIIQKEPFLGPGMKVLKRQLSFPFKHPIKFGNNCTYPARHPRKAFIAYSDWVEPMNSGLSSIDSVSGTAASVGVFAILGKNFHGGTTNNTTVVRTK